MAPEFVCSKNYFFTTYMAGDEHISHCPDDPLFWGGEGEFVDVFSKFGVLWPGTLARREGSNPTTP